jgi:hypothetical protein
LGESSNGFAKIVNIFPDNSWYVSPVIFEHRPNYKCPNCQIPMMIAGKHEKGQVEGQSKEQQIQCHSCDKRVIPVRITS